MKKFALLLLTALLALPASLHAEDITIPPFSFERNEGSQDGWDWKIILYPETEDQLILFANGNGNDQKYVNGEEFFPGYTAQFTGRDIVLPSEFTYWWPGPTPSSSDIYLNGVDAFAFRNCQMNSIVFPETVSSIGVEAFCGCNGLTRVYVPETVTNVARNAFRYCDNLVEFEGPWAVDNGQSLVVGTTLAGAILNGVTTYTIPENVTYIGITFTDLMSLEEVIIPEGVTSYDVNLYNDERVGTLFENCGIKKLRVPDSMRPNSALIRKCPNLEKFEGSWASEDGRFLQIPFDESDYRRYEMSEEDLAMVWEMVAAGKMTAEYVQEQLAIMANQLKKYKDKYSLVGYAEASGGTSVEIPDYVSVIRNAFLGCESIEEIVLPTSVMEFSGAFQGCINLETVNIPKYMDKISSASFLKCENLTEFIAPATLADIGQNTFNNCTSLKKVEIPSKSLRLRGSDFLNCPNLEYIELGATDPGSFPTSYYRNSFAPGYASTDDIKEADEINDEAYYDIFRSKAVLVVPRGCGDTYNNSFPDWNYMTKENLMEKDMPSNVYVDIQSEENVELYAKFVNVESVSNWTTDESQNIIDCTANDAPDADLSSFFFKPTGEGIGTTNIFVNIAKGTSSGGGDDDAGHGGFFDLPARIGSVTDTGSGLTVSFMSKITVVDMSVPYVELPQGSTFTIPDDDIDVKWPGGAPEGLSLSYDIADPTYVSLSNPASGEMLADPLAPVGSSATMTVTLKDHDGNVVLTRPVNIVVTAAGGVPTAIETIETQAEDFGDNAVYYNLNGVRVSGDNLAPGFYVVKGAKSAKKILVK